jgi:hypothetical protein
VEFVARVEAALAELFPDPTRPEKVLGLYSGVGVVSSDCWWAA